MTGKEILTMNPGRELDAMVAETMGYKAYKEKRGEYELAVTQRPGDRKPWARTQKPDPERYTEITCIEAVKVGFYGTGFPCFSKDISVAWEVVEKLGEFLFEVHRSEKIRGLAEYKVNILKRSKEYPDDCWNGMITIVRKTAPEAICKAALLAVLND